MLLWYPRLEHFWQSEDLNIIFPREGQALWYAVRCYHGSLLFPEARKQLDGVTARGYGNCEG